MSLSEDLLSSLVLFPEKSTKTLYAQGFSEVPYRVVCVAYFLEHLKREWSAENLLFYRAVDTFKQLCEEGLMANEERIHMAKEIYANFIHDDAINMVRSELLL